MPIEKIPNRFAPMTVIIASAIVVFTSAVPPRKNGTKDKPSGAFSKIQTTERQKSKPVIYQYKKKTEIAIGKILEK